jgi:hypothetical protein
MWVVSWHNEFDLSVHVKLNFRYSIFMNGLVMVMIPSYLELDKNYEVCFSVCAVYLDLS